MLDTRTKKRIDDCRDILVGKLPDPKAQIEQITIGLIYKFMNDMDKEVIELGGKASFFADYTIADPEFPEDREKDKPVEFSKFSWDNLLKPNVTATEMLNLYSEAIMNMDKNPNIPQLFRDIFKNAYLPYRDPETLKLFLKTIDEFSYTHSEKLGDAFEYLLSVMGSQADAGQFRTPRHIIDFLVSIIDPDKVDSIFDPACGTAGFLISAYKHILLKNTKENEQNLSIYEYNKFEKKPFNNLGNMLKPDEKKKLIENFAGYDISPDMVRLSLVNLYLHGFPNPDINEYDTLSSEERWNERFDLVLANPPFMSPKGGIRPHKKFSIKSNRSEVLFVDYIAEHLNLKGKAGVIVPEGIIFQSGTAYKSLRKMLVETCLYAVVSLPAGVFNPYSGVKTSILLMDKEVANRTKEILFVKIDNDGYNLGAQRTAVKGSQLEETIALIQQYRATTKLPETTIAHLVQKSEISKNGDYNLSGSRYLEAQSFETEFITVNLEDVLDYEQPTKYIVESEEYNNSYKTPVLTAGKTFVLGFTNETSGIYNSPLPVIIFDDFTTATKFVDFPFKVKSSAMKILKARPNANISFLYYLMQNIKFDSSDHKRYWISEYSKLEIPLPPLSVQEEIVAEIAQYQKIIDGARAVVANYKPKIQINPDWLISDLGKTATIVTGKLNANAAVENGRYPFFTCSKLIYYIDNYAFDCEALMLSGNNASAVYDVKYYNGKFNAYQRTYVITINSEYRNKLLYPFVQNMIEQQLNDLKNKSVGGLTKYLTLPVVKEIRIPLPDVEIQQEIVAKIEKEQELVNANKQLIEIFEQKIKDVIAKVWGE